MNPEPSLARGFQGLLVRDAMVQRPATLGPEVTVGEARAHLDNVRVHQLLVVADEFLVGTLELQDLAEASDTEPAAAYAVLDGRTIAPDRDLTEAHAEMVASGQRRLAVVDETGTLLGLLCLKRKLNGFCTDDGVEARAAERHTLDR